MSRESGFSLVELMVVTAIVAILATVAIPAYVNYVNRMNQGDAVAALMNAKMDQEEFYENHFPHRYAGTIDCLPSCNKHPVCLNNCSDGACVNSYQTGKNYIVAVEAGSANTQNFRITASKKLYSYRATDILVMSATIAQPAVRNESALGFSLFGMLFR